MRGWALACNLTLGDQLMCECDGEVAGQGSLVTTQMESDKPVLVVVDDVIFVYKLVLFFITTFYCNYSSQVLCFILEKCMYFSYSIFIIYPPTNSVMWKVWQNNNFFPFFFTGVNLIAVCYVPLVCRKTVFKTATISSATKNILVINPAKIVP